jgi:hypothetical protein
MEAVGVQFSVFSSQTEEARSGSFKRISGGFTSPTGSPPAKFASFARFRIVLNIPVLPDILSMTRFLSADANLQGRCLFLDIVRARQRFIRGTS